ncbi:MAG: SLC13 family permease [Clostridiales bacterium]|nr:SLC13 family permease [Clostridiales bacterium]
MKKTIAFILLFALMLGVATMAFAGDNEMTLGEEAAKEAEMNRKAIFTLVILAVAAVLFFTEIIPLPIVAILVPVALSFPGIDILKGVEAFSHFGNKWVIIFLAMFMVGEAASRTGFADKVGRATVNAAGTNQIKLIILVMFSVGVMSAFLSNTGTTVVFIPMVLGVCARAGLKHGQILMPMAFAASLGGAMTMIGTPPNGIINSALENAGMPAFGFFEFAKIGLPLFIVGIIYYALIGYKSLPNTEADIIVEEKNIEYRTNKMPFAIAIFIFVVVMMASGWMHLTTAAMLGACLVVATGCITMEEAFSSVSWTTIFLFAGMLSMSEAMQVTGAANMIADMVVANVNSPLMLLAVTYIITAIVTNFMSNTATSALMAPIGIALASGFGISPAPVFMAIAMAASACFLTPIATPPNTIVLGPGGYRFADYAKAGWALQVITAIVSIILIPMIWPF